MAHLIWRGDCDPHTLQYFNDNRLELLATTKSDQEVFDHLQSFCQYKLAHPHEPVDIERVSQLVLWISSLMFTIRLWGDLIVKPTNSSEFLSNLGRLRHDLNQSIEEQSQALNREFLDDFEG